MIEHGESPPPTGPRWGRALAWTVGFVFFSFVFGIIGCLPVNLFTDLVMPLSGGWIKYPASAIGRLHPRWDRFGELAALVLLLAGAFHLVVKFLVVAIANRQWPIRATAGVFGMAFVLIVSGAAVTAIAGRLLNAVALPGTFTESERAPWNLKRSCAHQEMMFAWSIKTYREQHSGRYPDDLPTLLRETPLQTDEVDPHMMKDQPADSAPVIVRTAYGPVTASFFRSYVYVGKDLVDPVDPNRIIVAERWENHGGAGMNVLHADGHVEWLDADRAAEVLPGLGFERVEAAEPKPSEGSR